MAKATKEELKAAQKKIAKIIAKVKDGKRGSQTNRRSVNARSRRVVNDPILDEKTATRKALTLKAFNAAYETHHRNS